MAEESLEDLFEAIEDLAEKDGAVAGQAEEEVERERLQILLNATDDEWSELSNRERLSLVSVLFNYSDKYNEIDGLERVIELNEQLEVQELEPEYASQWYYQLGNAHSVLAHKKASEKFKFNFFDSNHYIKAIGYKRAAVVQDDLDKLSKGQVSRTYVNLANILAETGRVCEAMRLYNNALDVSPDHGMALANRGQVKWEYSMLLFNNHQKHMFLHSAYLDLKVALEHANDIYPGARASFQLIFDHLKRFDDRSNSIHAEDEQPLGDSEEEIAYNKWVLNNRLFLNPLNDISTHTYAAYDNFHLPNMILPDEDFPYPGMYNRMKQEFVSARYIFYEGLTGDGNHFSDRRVRLENTLDYSVSGYRTEQTKTALRLSYSIFDKIAVFLNNYYSIHEIAEDEDEPSFDEVWYPNMTYDYRNLHAVFETSTNWALNALYWLKKDFSHYISERDDESSIIVAHELRSVRNAAEHDYFKVIEDSFIDKSQRRENAVFQDTIYDAIGEHELKRATMEMLRLSRAALFYLSFAVHIAEEAKREAYEGVLGEIKSTHLPNESKK